MSRVESTVRDLPTKLYFLCALLLGVVAILPWLVLAPAQSANQIMSQGAVSTAVITDSYITTGRYSRTEHVQFIFTDSTGRSINGAESRSLPPFAEMWNTGRTVPVHYLGGKFLLGDVLPDSQYALALIFSLLIPTLLWSIVSCLREGPRARDDYESSVLRPRLKPPVIEFDPLTGRSEVVGGESGIRAKAYRTLNRSTSDGQAFVPVALSMVCATLACSVILSQLTMARPSPETHIATLVLFLIATSFGCLVFAGWSYRLYLRGLDPEIEDELERRRGLIFVHRESTAAEPPTGAGAEMSDRMERREANE